MKTFLTKSLKSNIMTEGSEFCFEALPTLTYLRCRTRLVSGSQSVFLLIFIRLQATSVLSHSAHYPLLTCTSWSLWQPRRHCISLKSWLLWRQEVGIRERRWCYIGGSYQCVARVTELQCALIGRLDCDWHGERLGWSCWLLQHGNREFHS